jgi:hypothetical protein
MKKVFLFGFLFLFITTLLMAQTVSAQSRGCDITSFSMNPVDPYVVGDHVVLSGESNCGTVRFEINGDPKSETGQPNQTMTWKTEEWGSGNYDVCFVARGEGGWENADRACRRVYVEGGQAPPDGSSNDGGLVKCWVNTFNVTPGSVKKGESFHLSGQGQCDGNARASRFAVDGNAFGEFGGYQTWADLGTNNLSTGSHKLCFEITGGKWTEAAVSCVTVKVTQAEQQTNDVVQGEQTDNNVEGQTDSSGPEGSSGSTGSAGNEGNTYLSRDYFSGWPDALNENRVYIPSDIDQLRLRTGPGHSFSILGYVTPTHWYLLKNENAEWAKIKTANGTVGWIEKQYVKIDHFSSSPGQTPPPAPASISTKAPTPKPNPTYPPQPTTSIIGKIDLDEPPVAASSASLQHRRCDALAIPVDEKTGTWRDPDYFLHVYFDEIPDPGTYTIKFFGIKLNLDLWSKDDGGYLRFGIPTKLAWPSLGAWKNQLNWSFTYDC